MDKWLERSGGRRDGAPVPIRIRARDTRAARERAAGEAKAYKQLSKLSALPAPTLQRRHRRAGDPGRRGRREDQWQGPHVLGRLARVLRRRRHDAGVQLVSFRPPHVLRVQYQVRRGLEGAVLRTLTLHFQRDGKHLHRGVAAVQQRMVQLRGQPHAVYAALGGEAS